jgi:hypothetical protein
MGRKKGNNRNKKVERNGKLPDNEWFLRNMIISSKGKTEEFFYCGYGDSEENLEDIFTELAMGYMDPEREEVLWNHIEGCSFCVRKIRLIIQSLEEIEKEWKMPYEKLTKVIRQKEKAKVLTQIVEAIFSRPDLKGLLGDIKNFINEIFSFPTPRFAPVFGRVETERIVILSPFGKARYPIIFQWRPSKGIEQYLISIEHTNWSLRPIKLCWKLKRKTLSCHLVKSIWELKP